MLVSLMLLTDQQWSCVSLSLPPFPLSLLCINTHLYRYGNELFVCGVERKMREEGSRRNRRRKEEEGRGGDE